MTHGDYEPEPATHEPIEKYFGFGEDSIGWWCEACKAQVSPDHLVLRIQREYDQSKRGREEAEREAYNDEQY